MTANPSQMNLGLIVTHAVAAEHVAVSHVRKAHVVTDRLAAHAVTTDRMIVVHAVMIAAHAVSLMMNANR